MSKAPLKYAAALFVMPLFLAPLLGMPAAARAEDQPAENQRADDTAGLFSQLDTNKDGQLAADEIPQECRSLFERLLRIGDKNSDGKLAADEFAAALKDPEEKRPDAPAKPDEPRRGPGGPGAPGGPVRFFERLDANKDGKVTLDEVPEPGRERFKKLIARADKDGDGAVSRREFLQAGPPPPPEGGPPANPAAAEKPTEKPAAEKPATEPAAEKPAEPAKPAAPPAPPAPPERPKRDGRQFFARLDKNGDGKLTADEVPEERRQGIERLIKRGDKNGDGALSVEELTAVFERPGGKPGKPEKSKKPEAAKKKSGKRPPGLFAVLDADRDGQLNATEISTSADTLRKLDKDNDGSVSAKEVVKGLKKN